MERDLHETKRKKLKKQDLILIWLIVKNQTDQMILVHRETGTTKTILI
ncbi:hypothetical protein J7E66_10545 [Bacillus sp. ISL-7]|nr:hypothetical protein [Bacillus sp. ISL-7]MBT2735175.1 hypothetical protein [Bacillus sp. ISL-7]